MASPLSRRPLQDLPLDQFATTPSITKRPLSPNATFPLSPAKRRLLSHEAFIALSPLRNRPAPHLSSPGRRLEFAMDVDDESLSVPSAHSASSTARQDNNAPFSTPTRTKTALAPSPELVTKSTASGTRSKSPTPHPPSHSESITACRHSVHYPGFDIYHDPDSHSSTTTTTETHEMDEDDAAKENVPEPRIAKKARKPLLASQDRRRESESMWPTHLHSSEMPPPKFA